MNKILLYREQFLQKFKDFFRSTVFDEEGVLESPNYLNYFLKKIQNASILMIPTAFNSGKLYVQEPTNRNEDFDVVRNSTVPRINQDGNWEEVPINTPCIDYSTGEPLLLTQPQSTNVIIYSEDFTQWSSNGAGTLVSNATESPNGTLDATEIRNTNVGSNCLYQINPGVLSAGNYTYSVYVKYKDGDIKFNLRLGGDGSAASIFIISENGVTLDSSEKRTKIEDVGNGWFRISVDYDANGTTANNVQLRGDINGTTNSYYIWGAQSEEQPNATSYIQTNGSVATRLQDTITDAGSVDTINSEEGVLYFEGAALTNLDGVNGRIVSLSDGTTNNRLTIRYDEISDRVKFSCRKDGVNIAIKNVDGVNVLDVNSFALAWDNQKIYTYVNEVLEGEITLSDIFNADTLDALSLTNGTYSLLLYAKTKELRVYKSIAQAKIDLPYIN